MKIVLTTSMAGLGGTENATFRLGRLLRQHGHDIILASSDRCSKRHKPWAYVGNPLISIAAAFSATSKA